MAKARVETRAALVERMGRAAEAVDTVAMVPQAAEVGIAAVELSVALAVVTTEEATVAEAEEVVAEMAAAVATRTAATVEMPWEGMSARDLVAVRMRR